jgi:negative regulator of replication initiation
MDGACASMGNHDAGYKMSNTHTPKDCTLACVKGGSKFVLYNAASKTIYQLDNQQKPRNFAGQKVKVVGTYNTGTKTIHVEKIEAGS